MTIEEWNLAASIGDERRAALDSVTSFAGVVDEIRSGMTVLCCHEQPCDDYRGFSRMVYCLSVPAAVFDPFFNSRHGYRAAYFRSPYEGLAANSVLLRSLLPTLLEDKATAAGGRDTTFIKESFASESAKAWLAEAGNKLCDQCEGEWKHPASDPIEITNGRWERGASQHARWGRTAPYLTQIRLFGAFLNERHDEFIAGRKRRRARDIHECGWS